MKLRFYAKDDLLVTEPGSPMMTGQPVRYVGRDFVPGTAATPSGTPAVAAAFPASSEPFECDSDTKRGQDLIRLMRIDTTRHGEQPLWPADQATADACGVPFVAVTVKDGVAVPASSAAPVVIAASAPKRSTKDES